MRYFSTPDNGVAFRDDPQWSSPPEWRPITEREYNSRMAILDEGIAIKVQEIHEDTQAQAQEDFDALIALGVPEGLAARLTGYKGDMS